MNPRTRKVVLQTKPGYRQNGYSRGVLQILLALDTVCRRRLKGVPRTLTLTSGTDSHSTGAHPPPRCEAVDVRSKTGFKSAAAKRRFLLAVIVELVGPRPEPEGGGSAGRRIWSPMDERAIGYEVYSREYFGILEHEGQPREHFHLQVRRGHTIGLLAST